MKSSIVIKRILDRLDAIEESQKQIIKMLQSQPKRKRRTKAEMEADNDKVAK